MSNEFILVASDKALDFISEEYNQLEKIKEGLGERFFDAVEASFSIIKKRPLSSPQKATIYRRSLINISKRIQYSIYFRLEGKTIFIDLILPNSINPSKHPS